MSDTFILQEILTNPTPFRVHNVKIDKFLCQQDLPMMLLAHYDRLSDELKAQKPLSNFFMQINNKVTTQEACQIFGISFNELRPATHIKFTGTSVIVWDEFPLALHLQFTNTAKDSQTSDKPAQEAILEQTKRLLLSGNVNVLHKNTAKTLISVDLSDDEFIITPNDTYTRLPNSHALATTQILNHLKDTNPNAMAYLEQALVDKVLTHFHQINQIL